MLYPAFLDLKGKKCLVAGGGSVAFRKVVSLLAAGAKVCVTAPAVCEEIDGLEQDGSVQRINSQYRPDLLDEIYLVIAATNDSATNRQVYKDAAARAILVNVVDEPDMCNFFVPAVLRRGDIVIAVSTSGKAPILSRIMREELERSFPEGFGELLEIVEEARVDLKAREMSSDERGAVLAAAIDSEIIEQAKKGEFDQIRERIRNCIS